MKALIEKLNDGGPIFTYTILVLILVILILFVKAITEKDFSRKSRSIVASVGWFALAWGYLGRTFGLIMAFEGEPCTLWQAMQLSEESATPSQSESK